MKREYIKKYGDLAEKDFDKEVKVLKKLKKKKHQNIVHILGKGRVG